MRFSAYLNALLLLPYGWDLLARFGYSAASPPDPNLR